MNTLPDTRPRNIVIGQPVKEGKQELAKSMRRNLTPAEQTLWQRLRKNQLNGLHFRRQQVISGLVADFYCHEAALVIEVDGSYHESSHDAERDAILAKHGIHVLRFTNDEVLKQIECVLESIIKYLDRSSSINFSSPHL